jgi:murein DD-endopeptidase MepM/ murein hydrolase activator NlpD
VFDKVKIFWAKLKNKFRIVAIDPKSFHEKWSIQVTWLTFISLATITFLIISALSFFTIKLTGFGSNFGDLSLEDKMLISSNHQKILKYEQRLNLHIEKNKNIARILRGEEIPDSNHSKQLNIKKPKENNDQNPIDSIFIAQFEEKGNNNPKQVNGVIFHPPTTGRVSKTFNKGKRHFGIDIATNKRQEVKSVLRGTIIAKEWTAESGFIVIIAHGFDMTTIYKHNSSIVVNLGQIVKAGEVIGFTGNTGSNSHGEHLHFELWQNGIAIDPISYLSV